MWEFSLSWGEGLIPKIPDSWRLATCCFGSSPEHTDEVEYFAEANSHCEGDHPLYNF